MLRALLTLLRVLADLRAIAQGPKAVAKRAARRAGYSVVRRLFR
jgi:hypothetical protein